YCHRRGLDHPEIDRFVNHLWEFMALPADGGGFDPWEKRQPALMGVGLGDDFPPGFDSVLKSAGESGAEFRQVLESATEVLYSSMYAATDEEGSRRYLFWLGSVAESVGVVWPDMRCFSGSKWSDCHGWGKRPSEQEIVEWKSAGRG